MNSWYPNYGAQPMTNTQSGVFTAWINSDGDVNDYLVPAGSMTVLIRQDYKKMWIKSVKANGAPDKLREFEMKEVTPTPPANSNGVSRNEFNQLTKQVSELSGNIQQILAAIQQKGGDAQ